jgi:SAM-dependent methyltransferase
MTQPQQGTDPKQHVFTGLSAVLYAACGPADGSYDDQSRHVAMAAEVALPGGLQGTRVLDVGSGFGATAAALMRHGPKAIVSVDSSAAQIDLFHLVLGTSQPISRALADLGAPDVLRDLYPPLVKYLETMRRDAQDTPFRRRGGALQSIVASSLDLWPDKQISGGPFDAIVGNNMLHWPVNQRIATYKKDDDQGTETNAARATVDALAPLRALLRDGGVAAFLGPFDFIHDDVDAQRYADLEANAMVAHPVFRRVQETLNRLLKERHGIDRAMPGRNPIFRLSRMGGLAERTGFHLERIAFFEQVLRGDPLASFFARLPMVMGGINLPFDAKLALIRDVRARVEAEIPAEERETPIRGQYFTFILRAV